MTQDDHAADAVRFMQMVAMFQMAAMQAMGKLVNPVTSEVERDLDQARASIEMLEMLQRRTEGNRGEDETKMLEKVLFELRMNFVDESRRPEPEEEAGPDESDESGGSGERDAAGEGDEAPSS